MEVMLYSTALGLGVISLFLLILGFMGFLYSHIIFIICIVLLLWSGFYVKKKVRQLSNLEFPSISKQPVWFKVMALIIVVYMFAQLLNCMTPVLNGDSIAWYLCVPKHFLENHSIMNTQLTEDYVSSNLPLNLFMLSTLGIAVRSEILSQLILGWLMSLLIFLILYTFAKRYIGRKPAFFCAILFYTMPTMRWLIYSAKMDLGYVMFELCFWSLFVKWFSSNDKHDLWISAVFLGFAMGSKYQSFITLACASIGLFIVLIIDKKDVWSSFKTALLFGIIALTISLPSLLKNLMLTGDPFFPFLSSYETLAGEGFDIYKSVLDIPRFWYNMTFGKEFIAKPLFWADSPLGFLPCILIPFIKPFNLKWKKGALFIVLSFVTILCISVMYSIWPFPRHILPAIALMLVLITIHSGSALREKSFNILGVFVVIALSVQALRMIGLSGIYQKTMYLLGKTTKQQYLSTMLFDKPKTPHMNSMMLAQVSKLPANARILALDSGNGYYVDRPLLKKGYVYDEADVDMFLHKCHTDKFTHIYYSDSGVKWYLDTIPNVQYVVLSHKESVLKEVFRSGEQHLYEILYNPLHKIQK